MEKSIFAQRLNLVLKEQGLRQVDVLEKAAPYTLRYNTKLTRSDLSQYVSGKVIPGVEKLSILAEVLNVDDAWLIGFNTPQKGVEKEAIIDPKVDAIISDIKEKLKIDAKFLTVSDLREYLNCSYWEVLYFLKDVDFLPDAKSENPEKRRYFIYDIAHKLIKLNTDSADFKADNFPASASVQRINVYGKIPSGVPIKDVTDIIDWVAIPASWEGEYLALQIMGDSMEPEYRERDIVIVRQQSDCESEQDCIVHVNGLDATLHRVVKQPEHIMLQNLNTAYESKTYALDDKESVVIAGVVVELRRSIL